MKRPGEARVEARSGPEIIEPTDAIIWVSAAWRYGSNLSSYQGVDENRPGDVMCIEPGKEHWYRARPNHCMAYVVMREADETGQVVTWLDHVSEKEYRQ